MILKEFDIIKKKGIRSLCIVLNITIEDVETDTSCIGYDEIGLNIFHNLHGPESPHTIAPYYKYGWIPKEYEYIRSAIGMTDDELRLFMWSDGK